MVEIPSVPLPLVVRDVAAACVEPARARRRRPASTDVHPAPLVVIVTTVDRAGAVRVLVAVGVGALVSVNVCGVGMGDRAGAFALGVVGRWRQGSSCSGALESRVDGVGGVACCGESVGVCDLSIAGGSRSSASHSRLHRSRSSSSSSLLGLISLHLGLQLLSILSLHQTQRHVATEFLMLLRSEIVTGTAPISPLRLELEVREVQPGLPPSHQALVSSVRVFRGSGVCGEGDCSA
jgi:hypothetical protein